MENKIESLELEEMRQQMQTLRKQLDEQLQVNDELVVKQFKSKVRSINNRGTFFMILSIVAALLVPVVRMEYSLSWAFSICTIISVLRSGIFGYFVTHMIKEEDMQFNTLSSLAEKVIRAKRNNRISDIWDIVDGSIVCVWLLVEILKGSFFASLSQTNQVIMCLGFVFALVVGWGFSTALIRSGNRNFMELSDTLRHD